MHKNLLFLVIFSVYNFTALTVDLPDDINKGICRRSCEDKLLEDIEIENVI